MAKKKPEWRDIKPQNTSWEPSMKGHSNRNWEIAEREYIRTSESIEMPPNSSTKEISYPAAGLSNSWGIGRAWLPDDEIKRRVIEMERRIAIEDSPQRRLFTEAKPPKKLRRIKR